MYLSMLHVFHGKVPLHIEELNGKCFSIMQPEFSNMNSFLYLFQLLLLRILPYSGWVFETVMDYKR